MKLGLHKEIEWLSKMEEILLIFLVVYVYRGLFILWFVPWGKVVVLSFVIYLLFGIISWFFSKLSLAALFLQFFLELKFPIVALAFIGAGNTQWLWDKFLYFAKFLLIVSIPLILWQFTSPGSYDAAFPAGAHKGGFVTMIGTLPRAAGVFWFTGNLAVFSATMTAIFMFLWLNYKKNIYIFWMLLSIIILLTTFSRQEIAACLVGLLFIYFIINKSHFVGEKLILFTLGTFLFFSAIPFFLAYTSIVIEQLELYDILSSTAARVVFYVNGFF